MIELYQAEWCPDSRRVRQRLTELGLSFVSHPVPAERGERTEMKERTGFEGIPVLVLEDGTAVGGEVTDILAALDTGHDERPASGGRGRLTLDELEQQRRELVRALEHREVPARQLDRLDAEDVLGGPARVLGPQQLVVGGVDHRRGDVGRGLERVGPAERHRLGPQPQRQVARLVGIDVRVHEAHRLVRVPDRAARGVRLRGDALAGGRGLAGRAGQAHQARREVHEQPHGPPRGDDRDGLRAERVPDEHDVVARAGERLDDHVGVVPEAHGRVVARQDGRHGPVPARLEALAQGFPARVVMPCAVHQAEGGHARAPAVGD
jgi:glutaredoxin